jgi:hypothetical protein
MPLDIATTLCVRDARSDGPASLHDIAHVVGAWAELGAGIDPFASGEWPGVGRKRADIRIELLDPGPGEELAWRLSLAHPDGDDPTIRWEVEVEATEPAEGLLGKETWVSVALSRTSIDSRVRQVRTDRPAAPRVIRELIEAPGFECIDGPVVLGVRAGELEKDEVRWFVDEILMSPERRLPVVGVSVNATTGDPRIDPSDLQRQLAGMAHVWLIPPDVTWSLGAALENRLGVYNGAVRIWWPGLQLSDSPFDHHLWLPDARHPGNEVAGVVSRSTLARHRPLGAVQRLRRAQRERDRSRVEEEFRKLRVQMSSTYRSDEEAVAGGELVSALQKEVGYLTDYQDALHEEIEQLNEQLRAREQELDQERNRARSLAATVRGLERAAPQAVVADPPTQAFLDEMNAVYLRRYTADDRRDWPLGDCRLHRDFLAALDALTGISREKVVEVCVDVATHRIHEITAREPRQMRVSDAGNSPQRIRRSDGAGAWRCSLQRNTPQARRLAWWAIPGGAVELAHVGLHDDVRCPE